MKKIIINGNTYFYQNYWSDCDVEYTEFYLTDYVEVEEKQFYFFGPKVKRRAYPKPVFFIYTDISTGFNEDELRGIEKRYRDRIRQIKALESGETLSI